MLEVKGHDHFRIDRGWVRLSAKTVDFVLKDDDFMLTK